MGDLVIASDKLDNLTEAPSKVNGSVFLYCDIKSLYGFPIELVGGVYINLEAISDMNKGKIISQVETLIKKTLIKLTNMIIIHVETNGLVLKYWDNSMFSVSAPLNQISYMS